MAADDRLVRHPGPRGISFSFDGRRLLGDDPRKSQESRLRAAATRSTDETGEVQTLVCVFSPLLGYGLGDFCAALGPGNAILVVELDPVLATLLDDSRSEIPRSLQVATATGYSDAAAAVRRFIHRFGIRRIRVVHLSGGVRLHADRYRTLTASLEDLIRRFWLNRATELRLNHRWIVNILRNSTLDARPVRELSERIRPSVLLLGAGPGLDTHLDWISAMTRHRRRRAFTLIAVDTVLGTLAARDIVPDVIWSMDAQLVNARDFLPWRWDDAAIVADLSAATSILRRAAPENRFVFATRYAELGLFSDPELRHLFTGIETYEPRGSVVPSIAEYLIGATEVARVLCIGVDFWYRSPRSHARASAIDRAFRREMTRLRRRDGFAEVEQRLRVETRLESGHAASADAALVDHAEQLRALLQDRTRRVLLWARLPAPAMPTGMTEITPEEATELLADDDLREGSLDRSHHGTPPSAATSRAPLTALLERLRVQERRFDAAINDATKTVYWDTGLDFVLRDLPQWPLMMARREWFDLHRLRILPILRDYRRRLERIVRIADVPYSSGLPRSTDRNAD